MLCANRGRDDFKTEQNTVVWDIDTYSLLITYEKTSSWTKNKNLKNFEHLVSKVPAAGWRQENSPASLVHPRTHHLLLNNHHHDQRHMLDHHDHHLARSKRFSLVTLTPLTRAASHSFLSCSIRYLNKQIHILYSIHCLYVGQLHLWYASLK